MRSIDEVPLNTLLANGVDAPTAYAASLRDEPQPAVNHRTNWFVVGILAGGLVVFLLLLL